MLIPRFRIGKRFIEGKRGQSISDECKFVVARSVCIRKGDATEPFLLQWNLLAGLVCRAL